MQQDDNDNSSSELSRLKWSCRRGMLELDVLLGNFLNEAYSELPVGDKKLFVGLLGHTDPEIFAWIMGHEVPLDEDLVKITEAIRHHARSRISP